MRDIWSLALHLPLRATFKAVKRPEVRIPQPIAALLSGYGMSGEGLARAIGRDDRVVQRVIEGADLPTPELAGRISQYLGAPEDSLFLPQRRVGKHYARDCRGCRAVFLPSGPNNMYCVSCRARRTR